MHDRSDRDVYLIKSHFIDLLLAEVVLNRKFNGSKRWDLCFHNQERHYSYYFGAIMNELSKIYRPGRGMGCLDVQQSWPQLTEFPQKTLTLV